MLYFRVLVTVVAVSMALASDEESQQDYTFMQCNGCVALVNEVCRNVMNHMEVLAEAKQRQYVETPTSSGEWTSDSVDGLDDDGLDLETTDEKDPDVEVYSNGLLTLSSVVAKSLSEACTPEGVMPYHAAPGYVERSEADGTTSLAGACKQVYASFQDEVDSFFRSFHRKEINCNRAVELVCAYVTPICEKFDTEEMTINGVGTTVYRPVDENWKKQQEEMDQQEF